MQLRRGLIFHPGHPVALKAPQLIAIATVLLMIAIIVAIVIVHNSYYYSYCYVL